MSDLIRISTLSAATIGRLIATGTISPVELTSYLFQKIDAYPDKAVFITLTKQRAVREAKQSEARHRAGCPVSPLDGVPIVYKDLVDLEGEVTTAGSNIYRNAPPAKQDATIAANLARAGMISLGKVNLTEFAYSGLGLNPHYGTPNNPHSPQTARVPGGSSAGTGVAIAAGLAPCGIGTDTGGSIRIPASFNGITGYKPSLGRIPDTGIFPLSRTLDSVGPLARSVEDCILLDMVMRGATHTPVIRRALDGITIIVPQTIVLDDLDVAVSRNFEASLARLSANGAKIVRQPMTLFQEVEALGIRHGSLAATDAYVEHQALMESSDIGHIDRRVMQRIMGGKKMSAIDVIILQREHRRLIAKFNKQVGNALIAMPTTPMTAPETAPLDADDDLFNITNLKALRNTRIGNTLDCPGVAIPNGKDANGMPTGFLLSCAQGLDNDLLGYSLVAEHIIRAAPAL